MSYRREVGPDSALSLVEVCERLNTRLAWYGLPRLKPAAVMEADGDTIVAVVAGDTALKPVRFAFDRHTGSIRRTLVARDAA
jgi:hypothetical protein